MTQVIPLPTLTDERYVRAWIEGVWGILLPSTSVCPGHVAPWDVFWRAFSNHEPIQIWKASRGFGGKSTMLATLAAAEALLAAAQSTVLGGSASQSIRVQEVVQELMLGEDSPQGLLAKDPTRYETLLTNGGWIRALMASQRSVRGPHPQKLRMDEIDEMEQTILEGALGQPMDKTVRGVEIPAHTIMSSTHQYPDGTMSAMIAQAHQRGWPVYEWCYKENHISNGGFLTDRMIEAKRQLVPQHMWEAEYDLQEPSFEGRAIDTGAVDRMFDPALGTFTGAPGKKLTMVKPNRSYTFATGVDWAKEKDWTVIATWRTDCSPWRLAAWERVNRMPWPLMVDRLQDRLMAYGGVCAHDATGIGNVIRDYLDRDLLDVKILDVVMSSRVRAALFNDFVAAVEDDAFRCPRIDFAYGEHKYATQDDLFGNSKSGHAGDSIVANAMAWYLRRQGQGGMVAPDFDSLTKASHWTSLEV